MGLEESRCMEESSPCDQCPEAHPAQAHAGAALTATGWPCLDRVHLHTGGLSGTAPSGSCVEQEGYSALLVDGPSLHLVQ